MATKLCSLANNNTKLSQALSKYLFKSSSKVEYLTNDTLKISWSLSSNKTHGHNITSIWMSTCNHDNNILKRFNTSKTKSDY